MMDELIDRPLQKLLHNLDELVLLYRQLLTVVRQEKELLLSAQGSELQELNLQKDQLLQKIRMADTLRQKHAQELAGVVQADIDNPRLLELAQKLPVEFGDRLRHLHSTLDIVIRRLLELNRENEAHAKSALQNLNGAMSNIKETLSGKKTYEKKGQMKLGPEQAGNFVRKEI
ncbi:MAG: flagellar protein FlgN [Bdellovibrionales bacterium]|jgi:flagellar biosynthesis/type III secretory pathway chaperone|nr:flagellar protein FlgN [Bdellovibrionales bacterium]